MGDVLLVEVVDGSHYLVNDESDLVFRQRSTLRKEHRVEVATTSQLSEDVDCVF